LIISQVSNLIILVKISDSGVGFVAFDGEMSAEGTPVNFFATASTVSKEIIDVLIVMQFKIPGKI
jgi:hypothetical protein